MLRNRRVMLAAAAGVVVLLAAFLVLWLTRGSDGVADAAADRTTTPATTTSSSSATTTSSPAASTPHSGTTSPTATTATTPTTTTPAPPPPPPAATTTTSRPTPAPVNWPDEAAPTYGRDLYAVYLVVAKDYSEAEQGRMDTVYGDLQAVGYTGLNGPLCDEGADAIGVDPYGNAVAVYFPSQTAAQQFLTGWTGPEVGSTKITVICGD